MLRLDSLSGVRDTKGEKISLPPHYLLWDSLLCHPAHHEHTLLRDSAVSWQLLLSPFTYTLVTLLVYVPLGENCAQIQLMGCDGAYSRQGQLKWHCGYSAGLTQGTDSCGSHIWMYNGMPCWIPVLPCLINARGNSPAQGLLHYFLLQGAPAETIKNPRRKKRNHNFKDKGGRRIQQGHFPVKQCHLPHKPPSTALLKWSCWPAATKRLLKLNVLLIETLWLSSSTSLFLDESAWTWWLTRWAGPDMPH